MRVKLNHEDGIINGIILLQNEVFKLQKWSVIFGKIVLLFVQKSMYCMILALLFCYSLLFLLAIVDMSIIVFHYRPIGTIH